MLVGGSSLVKASTLVGDSDAISVESDEARWASRGGIKLEHALDVFDIDVTGARALDVGASTGGFTDVLLAHGAAHITALDVGYGQLLWRLRDDTRVEVLDRVNFRTIQHDLLGDPFDVIVVDVSFISVGLLAGQLARVGKEAADYVVLVKPQFEAGREAVGRGGGSQRPGRAVRSGRRRRGVTRDFRHRRRGCHSIAHHGLEGQP